MEPGEPMKLARLFSGVLVALVGSAAASSAQASDVDWKMYGGASVSGAEICFYDAKGAVRTPDKYVGVWTKCLSQKDIDNVDIKHDFSGRIVENAARKMINGYVPPIALVEDIDFDQATVITGYEETANISGIKPHSNIFYEINCSQKMLRESALIFWSMASIDQKIPERLAPHSPRGERGVIAEDFVRPNAVRR